MTLHDIAEINPKTDVRHLRDNDLVSFIPMSDLTDDGRWLGDDTRTLRSVRHGYTAFAEGDVLFAKITPCMENGKGARVRRLRSGVGFGSTEYHVLRARVESDANFVYQWTKFRELRGNAANAMTGSAGQQRVPSAFIAQYPITEHGSDERSKIAQVLSKLDDAIEQTEALLAKQQRIKTGLMHDLLTRGLDAQGRLRPPDEVAPALYKHSPSGRIPVSWEVYDFGRLANYHNGGAFNSRNWKEHGLPIIRIQNLNGNEDYNHYDGPVNPKWEILAGDLVFAWSGTLETSFGPRIWRGRQAVLNQHIFKVVPHEHLVSREFLYRLFLHHIGDITMSAHGFKSSFVHVTRSELTSVRVRVPLVDEQQRILGAINCFEHNCFLTEASLTKLRRLKTGLMHDLLTGRVAVTPLLGGKAAAGGA